MNALGGMCRSCIGCCTRDKGVGPFVHAEELLNVLQPTDLIEFKRETCIHWGMYAGYDSVIHLCNMGNGVGKVDEELFLDVANGDKCRINNKVGKLRDLAQLPGFNDRRGEEEIISGARKWLYPELDLPYNVLTNNCEHICMQWKYGVSKSEQVEVAAKLVAISVAGTVVTPAVGVGMAEAIGAAAKAAAEAEAKAKADEEKAKAKAKADEEAEKLKGNCLIM